MILFIPIKLLWNTFIPLVKKNFLVRKKHWGMSLIVQIIIPIFLILSLQLIRIPFDEDNRFRSHKDNRYHDSKIENNIIRSMKITLRFTPKSSVTKNLMEQVGKCLGLESKNIIGYSDEATMINEIASLQEAYSYQESKTVGIVFEKLFDKNSSKIFKYKLRSMNSGQQELFSSEDIDSSAENWNSDSSNLAGIQICIDKTYINLITNNKPRYNAKLSIQLMPHPPHETLSMNHKLIKLYIMVFGFIMMIVTYVEVLLPAKEKYSGASTLMAIHGVKHQRNLFSWLMSGAIVNIFYLLPITMILKFFTYTTVMHIDTVPATFAQSNWFIVWLAFNAQTFHIFCFGYHLSSYFRKPLYGAVFASLSLIATAYCKFSFMGSYAKISQMYFGIICSPYLLLESMLTEIFAYETRGTGVNWSTIFIPGIPGNPFERCMGIMIIFSILGALFHFVMAVYIHALFPGKYGFPRSLFFFLQSGRKNNKNPTSTKGNCEPAIQIENLKKTYTRGLFWRNSINSLQGISINFYKSEITVLLGRNGAGKSTMMAIMSGLTTPSDGVVLINGIDIKDNPNTIRNNVSFCPQENIVLTDLNVYQQLMFFGSLRTRTETTKQLKCEIDILLSKLNLTDMKNFLPDKLSGGQLRKLCFAIMAIRDANVLIYDEPTSGVDAEGRREIWNIILKLREEKTIIISTHNMEEADILGDKIALMDKGKVDSYGTPKSLKNLHTNNRIKVTLFIEPSCILSNIIEEIGVPVNILDVDKEKIVLEILWTEHLPETLDKLESLKKKLKITVINISSITLDQIFPNIAKKNTDETTESDEFVKLEKNTGVSLVIQTFMAFFYKKFAFARNNPLIFWITLLLPSLPVIILLDFKKNFIGEPMELSLNAYRSAESFIRSSNISLAEMYEKTITDHGGRMTILKPEVDVRQALINFANENGIKSYKKKQIISAEFSEKNSSVELTGFYSGTALHSMPITINCLTNALLKDLSNDENMEIKISSQQLLEYWEEPESEFLYLFYIALSVMMFLIPAVSLYVNQPIQEQLSGIKQLQNMTGASKFSYWVSNFIFDFLQYGFSVLLFMMLLILFDYIFERQFYHNQEIEVCLIHFLLFGISVLPFYYMISFLRLSVITVTIISILLPLFSTIIAHILSILKLTIDFDIFNWISDGLLLILNLMPPINLVKGLEEFYKIVPTNARCRRMTNQVLVALCSKRSKDSCCKMSCSNGFCKNPMSYYASVPPLQERINNYLLCFCISTLIIFIVEQQIITKILIRLRWKCEVIQKVIMDEFIQKEEKIIDEEVKNIYRLRNEKEKVETKNVILVKFTQKDEATIDEKMKNIYQPRNEKRKVQNENVLLVKDLKKHHGKLKVVKNISFRVKQGECFGLLGVNGAGKSSTFRILTGIDLPHGGMIYFKKLGLYNQRTKILAEIGYCPQRNSLIDSFDARDHLYLFARLRGVRESQIKSVVEMWIRKLDLTACAAQPSSTYSGGNKRKLNIAIALIGNPSLILMDEPTSGLDPIAVQSLRNIFKTCQENKQSILLTSQDMNECEVYCDRMVIMEFGRLACIGSSQELKQRYGIKFSIHIKLSRNHSNYELEKMKSRLEVNLNCKKVDGNSDFIEYLVTHAETTWKSVYNTMNLLKHDFSCIEDFTVSSSSLEHFFLEFCRASRNLKNEKTSKHHCIA